MDTVTIKGKVYTIYYKISLKYSHGSFDSEKPFYRVFANAKRNRDILERARGAAIVGGDINLDKHFYVEKVVFRAGDRVEFADDKPDFDFGEWKLLIRFSEAFYNHNCMNHRFGQQ